MESKLEKKLLKAKKMAKEAKAKMNAIRERIEALKARKIKFEASLARAQEDLKFLDDICVWGAVFPTEVAIRAAYKDRVKDRKKRLKRIKRQVAKVNRAVFRYRLDISRARWLRDFVSCIRKRNDKAKGGKTREAEEK